MFKKYCDEKLPMIEAELEKLTPKSGAIAGELVDAMRYSLTAGGKRLRPILLMAAADAVGGAGERYLRAACALEMIHTYSLIHDDLPAMDDDDLRRGKPTNHKVYGEAMAILAGDALLTKAFETMCGQENADADRLLRVIGEVSAAAGADGMVGGQALDLLSENKTIDRAALETMHQAKTGALFRAAIRSGAILAGADEEKLAALTLYAEKFGLAFQITDDILDVAGDAAQIGKPVGSDARNHKSTYVALSSLEDAKAAADEAVKDALAALNLFGARADFLREAVKYLISRNS